MNLRKKLVTISQVVFFSVGFSSTSFAQKLTCIKGLNYSNKNLIIADYQGKSETAHLKNIIYCKSFNASVKKFNQYGSSSAIPLLISKTNMGVAKFVLKAEAFTSFLPVANGEIMTQQEYSEELNAIVVNTLIDYNSAKGVHGNVFVKLENDVEISVTKNPAAELKSPTVITISGYCPEKLVVITPKSAKECDNPLF